AGKSSATITAPAVVVLAAAAYLGLETNVSCPAPASSMPATPLISNSGEPFSRRAPNEDAISPSFMLCAPTPQQAPIVTRLKIQLCRWEDGSFRTGFERRGFSCAAMSPPLRSCVLAGGPSRTSNLPQPKQHRRSFKKLHLTNIRSHAP